VCSATCALDRRDDLLGVVDQRLGARQVRVGPGGLESGEHAVERDGVALFGRLERFRRQARVLRLRDPPERVEASEQVERAEVDGRVAEAADGDQEGFDRGVEQGLDAALVEEPRELVHGDPQGAALGDPLAPLDLG
jgi:hypothetical protein